jgi:hypothetical protein
MNREIPPAVTASLDQHFAEADEKYGELVEMLRTLVGEHGTYGALAIMAHSLETASKKTLTSIVITGMQRDLRYQENSA